MLSSIPPPKHSWNSAKDRFIAAQIRLIKVELLSIEHFIDIQDYEPSAPTELLNRLSYILENV